VDSASLRSKNFSRILLVKPTAMGDVIHAIPVLVKLRARYPGAQIDWLVTPENAELVREHPALSNAVIFERKKIGPSGWIRLLMRLREARYDLVIDLQGLFRSALFSAATRAPVRIGFARAGAREGAWLAYTHHIAIQNPEVHAIDRYLWLAPMLGLDDAPPDLRVYPASEAVEKASRLIAENRFEKFAVLVPGTKWETKHWSPERFAEAGRALAKRGFGIFVAGSPDEKSLCAKVAALCPGAIDLAGKTSLSELAAILERTAICITNDSGPMHLAVALGRPVVSIFGPTNPVLVGPYGHPESVVRSGLACSPCRFRKLSQCPHDHACMEQVSAAMVIERIDAVLGANRG
jgi:lipopolysaccharide heptosyltransferase I